MLSFELLLFKNGMKVKSQVMSNFHHPGFRPNWPPARIEYWPRSETFALLWVLASGLTPSRRGILDYAPEGSVCGPERIMEMK